MIIKFGPSNLERKYSQGIGVFLLPIRKYLIFYLFFHNGLNSRITILFMPTFPDEKPILCFQRM